MYPILPMWALKPFIRRVQMATLLERIKWKGLSATQYVREQTEKTQFYIHHTAGGPDPFSVVNWWQSTPDRVATHFIIGGMPFNGSRWVDGDLVQCYNTKYWAYHLGLKASHLSVSPNHKTSKQLNSESITVEICNWEIGRASCRERV